MWHVLFAWFICTSEFKTKQFMMVDFLFEIMVDGSASNRVNPRSSLQLTVVIIHYCAMFADWRPGYLSKLTPQTMV